VRHYDPAPILALREKCERAALNGHWAPPFRSMSPMLDSPRAGQGLDIRPLFSST